MSSEEESEDERSLEHRLGGDGRDAGDLFSLVYEELHALAERQMGRQGGDHTLQATALVNEAYLRLFGHEWRNREHFLCVAAKAMRSILVDHARKKKSKKRDGGGRRISLDELAETYTRSARDLMELDEALDRLGEVDPELVRLVELRFFGGLTMEETASLLDISVRTAQREWGVARAWLWREMR